jgi:hypothetical protein
MKKVLLLLFVSPAASFPNPRIADCAIVFQLQSHAANGQALLHLYHSSGRDFCAWISMYPL